MFKNTFSNIMSASSKLVSSLNASNILGIEYFSFVLMLPGDKDIVIRSKRIDQLTLWVNILANVCSFCSNMCCNIMF